MADNYLEKRYEEVFGRGASGTAAKARTPGVEVMLRRISDDTPFDPDYKVMDIQMDAIMRVVPMLSPDICARLYISCNGNEILIRAKEPQDVGEEDFRNGAAVGAAVQSILFKAAGLGLRGKVTLSDGAVIRIGK